MSIVADISPDPPTTTSTPTTSAKGPAMTTTLIDTPADEATQTTKSDPRSSAKPRAAGPNRVTFGRIIAAEWLKFRTVRSNVIALGSAAAAAIGFGALFASVAGSGTGPDFAVDGLSLSLGGFRLSQMIIAILGVSLVANEYQTGLIRTWFGAAPDRLRVLGAKVGVYGGLVLVVAMTSALLAFVIGQALLPGSMVALSLGSEGVLQALIGTAFYSACIGMMGIGLGFLLRSTAAGAGAVVTTLMIAPIMITLLPASFADPVGKFLPSNAATAVQGLPSSGELLTTTGGVLVLLAWVIGVVGAAAVVLKRRDA